MLEVKDVSKSYNSVPAVSNLSFSASDGDVIGLLGLNGAGKTTLMRIISGFLAPDKGTVTLDNISLAYHPDKFKKLVGYLPENNPLYLDLTVNEFLDFSYGLQSVNAKDFNTKLAATLEQLGLTPKKNAIIGSLSKGYRQRVGIAAAIIHSPRLLIMDEPTEGLDPVQRVEIRELIKKNTVNTTMIISSHVLDEIKHMCNRVIIINKGVKKCDESINSELDLDKIFLKAINE